MHRALRLHPDSRNHAAQRIDVAVRQSSSSVLELRYIVHGSIEKIAWAPPSPSTRADGLWRHTCFEAFVQRRHDGAYCEYNFAPSTQWAAYGFERYRAGMRHLDMAPPAISSAFGLNQFTLEVELCLPVDLAPTLRLALSAVVEELDGTLSYWAIHHPAGKPDFHHPDAFALELGWS